MAKAKRVKATVAKPIYAIYRTADGELLAETRDDPSGKLEAGQSSKFFPDGKPAGGVWNTSRLEWEVPEKTLIPIEQFLKRFTPPERRSIYEAAGAANNADYAVEQRSAAGAFESWLLLESASVQGGKVAVGSSAGMTTNIIDGLINSGLIAAGRRDALLEAG